MIEWLGLPSTTELLAVSRAYQTGDPVIFRATKHSAHPGPRAQAVNAEVKGEGYWYEVDKFWVVAETHPDGRLVLRTRRGKTHQLQANDPRLRPARWWERIWYRDRFPQLDERSGASTSAHGA